MVKANAFAKFLLKDVILLIAKKILYLFLILLLGVTTSCKNFKQSKVGKLYHNTTARYNIYFNGNERLNTVKDNLFQSSIAIDDYTKVLFLYPIGTESAAKSAFSDLDYVIKKGSKTIRKHDVSKWIDESYFMIGEAYFYKRDYFAAMETFQFITEKYKGEPTAQRSMIWIGKCYLELKKLSEAQAQLSLIKTKNFPQNLVDEYNLVWSDYYRRTEEYKDCLKYLEKGVKGAPDKKHKLRFYFIMAQLYAKLGKQEKSHEYYKMVIRKNAPFELSFQAKMGLADAYSSQTDKQKKSTKKFLINLTKDEKNADFFDQVYYQLAAIAIQEKQTKQALVYLKRSSATSKKNIPQKIKTLEKLADMHHNLELYGDSKNYYDSAIAMITKDVLDGDKLKPKYQNHSLVNDKLSEIQKGDSLLKIAKLNPTEILSRIDNIIKKKQALAELEKQQQEKINKELERQNRKQENFNQDQGFGSNSMNPFGNMGGGGFDNNGEDKQGGNNAFGGNQGTPNTSAAAALAGGSGAWYFYNEINMKNGEGEFRKKWGNRDNVDNWRRVKGNGMVVKKEEKKDTNPTDGNKGKEGSNNIDTAQKSTTFGDITIPADKKPYFDSIPFKPYFTNQKIQEAMFMVGNTYHKPMKEYALSSIYLEKLLDRYPDNPNVAQSHYLLYLNYTELKDEKNALIHKDFILKNYPSSDYAMMIMNPNAKMKNSKRDTLIENLYAQTYNAYKQGNCQVVNANFIEAIMIKDNYLMPKFDYLNVLCNSKLDSGKSLIDTLKSLEKRYPGNEISKEARRLIQLLESKKTEEEKISKVSESTGKKKTEYTRNDQAIPFVCIAIGDEKANIQNIKGKLTTFHQENFENDNLDVFTIFLDKQWQLVLIKNFPEVTNTYKYLVKLKKEVGLLESFNSTKKEIFIITNENVNLLKESKDINKYIEFFNKNY